MNKNLTKMTTILEKTSPPSTPERNDADLSPCSGLNLRSRSPRPSLLTRIVPNRREKWRHKLTKVGRKNARCQASPCSGVCMQCVYSIHRTKKKKNKKEEKCCRYSATLSETFSGRDRNASSSKRIYFQQTLFSGFILPLSPDNFLTNILFCSLFVFGEPQLFGGSCDGHILFSSSSFFYTFIFWRRCFCCCLLF